MWVFADFGLLMPAIVPEDDELRTRDDWDEASQDGKFDFQVRGRILSQVQYFLDTFMEEGTYGTIIATPDHDYNYRFYTTQEAYADAMREAIMAIDYRKFKPAAERYEEGHHYHNILVGVWAKVCDLNTPGDIWGPWTPENPKGYRSTSYHSRYEGGTTIGRRIGDSFENIDFGDGEDDLGWYDPSADDEVEFLGYDYRKESIIAEMDELHIPMSDWPENLLPTEFNVVEKELRKHFSKKTVKRMRDQNKAHFFLT